MTNLNPGRIFRMTGVAAAAALVVTLAACGKEPSSPPPPKVSTPAITPATQPAAAAQTSVVTPEAKKSAPSSDRDAALARRVKEALLGKPALKAHGIDITARGGVVTLFGTADSLANRNLAGETASGVEGVTSVDNRLAIASGS
jgi:hyperosmotically inducible periplasmic protein